MAPYSVLQSLREQFRELPVARADLSSKTLVVVGANTGLGLEASVHFATMGPERLLVTCRDEKKCEQAKRDIVQRVENGVSSDAVVSWPLNMDSFDSVCAFADRFEAEEIGKIDALVANAGIASATYTRTSDGWEKQLQVNYLSTALLSILMLPHLIKASSPESASRLVIVSSEAYNFNTHLKDISSWPNILHKLNDETYCTAAVMQERYNLSKLLQVLFVRELAAHLPSPTPVAASTLHPGLCHSAIDRDITGFLKYFLIVLKSFSARSTEMGSRTLVHPAVAPDERSRHGKYLSSCEVMEYSDWVLSDEGKETAKRVWAETIEVLTKIDPRVEPIVREHLSS
ncbi:short-chain dehydrogenase [Hygrophoropsis aurantiaca]|uniref:Short-chain dehydrogenase n=1 Tax=Hygrophoropsis aurantiaca TaxID=72124 RepID=A0ACB7ZQ59_9AGAM|nr:short-chain dehydrogenase [Hygrophoropsis aurantiaca]